MDAPAGERPDGEIVIGEVEEEVLVLSDGHVVAHQIEEVVDVAVSIEEEMMLEAAMIEDAEEH
jgi:hypothetical protein